MKAAERAKCIVIDIAQISVTCTARRHAHPDDYFSSQYTQHNMHMKPIYICPCRHFLIAHRRPVFNAPELDPSLPDWTRDGIIYLADDDNVYDLDLFDLIRNVRRVGIMPVGAFLSSYTWDRNGRLMVDLRRDIRE